MNKSTYYQAYIPIPTTHYFTAILRGYEHLCFDRTLEPASGLFEFFLSPDQEESFVTVMELLQSHGLVSSYYKAVNRL